MILICTVEIISGIFFSKAQLEGKMISQNATNYYVDFSQDLKKNNWLLADSKNGKKLVNKDDCVKK